MLHCLTILVSLFFARIKEWEVLEMQSMMYLEPSASYEIVAWDS
jgi:hypothetical protein